LKGCKEPFSGLDCALSTNFVCKHNFGLKNFAPLKIFQKKKKKKRKCSDRVEGKCDAIFFQKNFGAKF